MGELNYSGIFPEKPKDGSDIYRYSNRKWVLAIVLLEISE